MEPRTANVTATKAVPRIRSPNDSPASGNASNCGLAFATRKKLAPTDADFLGHIEVGGKTYRVRAYWNTRPDGGRFLEFRLFALRSPQESDHTLAVTAGV
jgi:hypothetical protein